MIRYRCPHCAALIVAHERRAGQSSVCKACVSPHQIPADTSQWLSESGEPLHPPAPVPADEQPDLAPTLPEILPTDLAPTQSESLPPDLAPTQPDFRLDEPAIPEFPAPGTTREREPAPEPVPSAAPLTAETPRPPLDTRATPEPSAEHEQREAAGQVATATPPPAVRRLLLPPPAAAPTPRRPPLPVPVRRSGGERPDAAFGDTVQLQTQADIAAALTAALTSRMKPPPAPRRDLRPSTAVWLLLTGLGLALVAVAVFTDPEYRWAALAVAALQVALGYAWIVRLTYLRDAKRGVACAIPPLTCYYLGQYKYAKFRPLRFVATGAALGGLVAVAPALHANVRTLASRSEPPAPAPELEDQSKLAQLRAYRDRHAYDPLIQLLEVLAKTDPLLSEDAKDRPQLVTELKALCGHTDTVVKVRAMAAYARWDPDGARAVCLAAVRSQTAEEREEALRLLPQWKDAESARAVQSLIGRPGTVESNRAKAALEEIGGVPAEQAAMALLNRADDQATKLTALSILEKVGGVGVVPRLQTYAMATDDSAVRARALAAAAAITARTRTSAP